MITTVIGRICWQAKSLMTKHCPFRIVITLVTSRTRAAPRVASCGQGIQATSLLLAKWLKRITGLGGFL